MTGQHCKTYLTSKPKESAILCALKSHVLQQVGGSCSGRQDCLQQTCIWAIKRGLWAKGERYGGAWTAAMICAKQSAGSAKSWQSEIAGWAVSITCLLRRLVHAASINVEANGGCWPLRSNNTRAVNAIQIGYKAAQQLSNCLATMSS